MFLKKIFGNLGMIVLLGTSVFGQKAYSKNLDVDYEINKNSRIMEYKIKIGKNYVIFMGRLDDLHDIHNYGENIMKIIKPDGTIIFLNDYVKNDLKIDNIAIRKNEEYIYYFSTNKRDKRVMQKGQKLFDKSLKKIQRDRLKEGLKSLKK